MSHSALSLAEDRTCHLDGLMSQSRTCTTIARRPYVRRHPSFVYAACLLRSLLINLPTFSEKFSASVLSRFVLHIGPSSGKSLFEGGGVGLSSWQFSLVGAVLSTTTWTRMSTAGAGEGWNRAGTFNRANVAPHIGCSGTFLGTSCPAP